MESILTSIKKKLGIHEDDTSFDEDVIIDINSVFATLTQLGAGPSEGFSIDGETETWNDYISDMTKLNFIKSYVYMKVKLMFDPNMPSAVIESYKEQIKEYEFRISVQADPGIT